MSRSLLLALCLLAPAANADGPRDRASLLQSEGQSFFKSGSWQQALDAFRAAHELAPSSDYLIYMAHCEYHLGLAKEALAHYRQFVEKVPTGDLAEVARLRIAAIERRPGKLVVNAEPEGVAVRIEGGGGVITGEVPNEFDVPRGRYRVIVTKPKFRTETREISVDVADTKWLSFKLDPIPGRLEIRTVPRTATLYVRGNRAQNPYLQQVDPGSYEVYAEAQDHAPRREVITVGPDQRLALDFALPYVQRSGRPEIIGFWTTAGAVIGSTAVLARTETLKDPASGTLVLAGALAGGIGGAVISTALAPEYIPDNRATFRIGATWIGAVEGAAIGLSASRRFSLSAGWLGGVLGLGAGAMTGTWLDNKSPTYGRVSLIQSAAVWGTLGGAMAVPALLSREADTSDYERYTPLGILVGLNVGLASGLAMAYLPDQRVYGPSWRRVLLVDLAGAAGVFMGALATTVDKCLTDLGQPCRFASNQPTARFALAGGALGLTAGWLLTRHYDRNDVDKPAGVPSPPLVPVPALLPTRSISGAVIMTPGLAAHGRF